MAKSANSKEQEAMMGVIFRPEKKPFGEEVKLFLYNSETGAVFGRTPASWAKIVTFYIIFYACLAAVFALLMLLVYYTLDPRIPKYQMDSSLIGTNPGLGFRPMPNDSNSLSTLIWYKGTTKKDYEFWTDSLHEFLDEYLTPGKTPGKGANIYECDYDKQVPPGKVCAVNIRSWHPCTFENNYNYHLQGPCVFIKLNKIYGWTPEYYDDPQNLPEKMPQDLKEHIKTLEPKQLKTVWVSCEGETPADVENIGAINYIPGRGFAGYYFPYENSEGYLSPLIAIHFERPKTGILLNIECKAWAKNIHHDRRDKLGVTHFELLID